MIIYLVNIGFFEFLGKIKAYVAFVVGIKITVASLVRIFNLIFGFFVIVSEYLLIVSLVGN